MSNLPVSKRGRLDAPERQQPHVRARAQTAGWRGSGCWPVRAKAERASASVRSASKPARRMLEPRPGRRLPFRYAVRSAHGYAVDAPCGQVGRVDEIRVAPWEFWPETLLVRTEDDQKLLIPVEAVAQARPRERRLILHEAPAGVRLLPHPPQPWDDREHVWQLQAVVGFVGGVGGLIALFVALALGVVLQVSLALVALGVIGAAASGRVWRCGRRTWLTEGGLVSAGLALVVGAILSLVWIFGG